jgi:hypothetical protein
VSTIPNPVNSSSSLRPFKTTTDAASIPSGGDNPCGFLCSLAVVPACLGPGSLLAVVPACSRSHRTAREACEAPAADATQIPHARSATGPFGGRRSAATGRGSDSSASAASTSTYARHEHRYGGQTGL